MGTCLSCEAEVPHAGQVASRVGSDPFVFQCSVLITDQCQEGVSWWCLPQGREREVPRGAEEVVNGSFE